MDEQHTPWGARISGLVLLLLGLAGLIAILGYSGEPVEFFPV